MRLAIAFVHIFVKKMNFVYEFLLQECIHSLLIGNNYNNEPIFKRHLSYAYYAFSHLIFNAMWWAIFFTNKETMI